MSQPRRNFLTEDKVKILRQHLLEKVPLSEICDRYAIRPTQFYQWQKIFFENGAAAFEKAGNGRKDSHVKKLERQNIQLKARLSDKDEVIAEIMESHVQLKKKIGQD